MTRFLAGRVLAGLITLAIFVTILFFMAEIIIPGDYATQFALGLDGAQLAELRARLGLDQPVLERYVAYMSGLVAGDLGDSGSGASVSDTLKAVLPWTLLIFVYALAVAFPVGHWLGKVAGWKAGAKGSAGLTIGSVGLYTIFPPLLVFLLVIFVSGLTDNQGMSALRTIFNESRLNQDTAWFMLWTLFAFAVGIGVTGLLLMRKDRSIPRLVWVPLLIAGPFLVWAALGMRSEVRDILRYLALPIVAVTILAIGEIVLVSKSTTAEAAHEDFVFTARAKGVPDKQIRDHHVARFALLPTLSKLMVSVPFILVGLMIIEISFAWPKDGAFGMTVPGMSSALFESLENRDTTVVVGGLLAVGLIVFGARLALDVLQAVLDPRIRVGSRSH